MLTLYDADRLNRTKLDKLIVENVEEAFFEFQVQDDETTRKLIEEIEKGKYYNEERFIDRFGAQVYLTELSTGCKAALCVHYLTDRIIDLKECGINARDAILFYCKEGNAIFYDSGLTINDFMREESKVDICINGKIFHKISEFNDYVF